MNKQHEGSRKTKPTYQVVAIYEIMEFQKIIGGMHEQGRGQVQGGASGDESEGDDFLFLSPTNFTPLAFAGHVTTTTTREDDDCAADAKVFDDVSILSHI